MAGQLALAQLSPYQLGGGVNKEAAFYGRAELISHILNRDPANYMVVGGRQVGKSSLLKALGRRYQEHPEWDCYYLVLSDKILIPRLARELGLGTSASLVFTSYRQKHNLSQSQPLQMVVFLLCRYHFLLFSL